MIHHTIRYSISMITAHMENNNQLNAHFSEEKKDEEKTIDILQWRCTSKVKRYTIIATNLTTSERRVNSK